MVCQCKFIDCNNCTTLVLHVVNGGGYTMSVLYQDSEYMGTLYFQFCCEPKTALKNKVY